MNCLFMVNSYSFLFAFFNLYKFVSNLIGNSLSSLLLILFSLTCLKFFALFFSLFFFCFFSIKKQIKSFFLYINLASSKNGFQKTLFCCNFDTDFSGWNESSFQSSVCFWHEQLCVCLLQASCWGCFFPSSDGVFKKVINIIILFANSIIIFLFNVFF